MEYERIFYLETGWEETLEKYQVQWAVLQQDSILSTMLVQSGWHELYRDTTAVILRR